MEASPAQIESILSIETTMVVALATSAGSLASIFQLPEWGGFVYIHLNRQIVQSHMGQIFAGKFFTLVGCSGGMSRQDVLLLLYHSDQFSVLPTVSD